MPTRQKGPRTHRTAASTDVSTRDVDIQVQTVSATCFPSSDNAAIQADLREADIQRRDLLLKAIRSGIARILTADRIEGVLPEVLEDIGEVARIHRMLVIEEPPCHGDEPKPYYSWVRTGLAPRKNLHEASAGTPRYDALLEWLRPARAGNAVFASSATSTGRMLELLDVVKLTSLLLVPILVHGEHWGSISFDDCSSEREWTADEINLLHLFADLVGVAVTRERAFDERERYIEELRNANTIIQNSPTILYRLRGEPSFPMVYVSQNIALLGYDPGALLDSPTLYRSYVHPEDRPRVQTAMVALLQRDATATTVEYRMLTSKGESRWVENRYTPVRDTNGRLVEVEGIMIDVTERKASEEKIARLARTDALTGLANRSTFTDSLKQAFAGAQRGGDAFAVLYLDLDRFKEINDTLGHPTGDRLLQQAAERLRRIVRQSDLVARLGGDEFAVLQTRLPEAAAAGVLALKIIESLSAPYTIDGQELRVGVSIGISVCAAQSLAICADELLAQADQALYRSKEAGRGRFHFHTAELDRETRERVELADELRSALERDELELYYQPQVELSSGRVTGVEALVRWNHPERGLLLPDAFLPIAEKSGLMQPLSHWVLDGACRQLREWRDSGVSVPLIAVNLSLAQVRAARELVADVKGSLARWNLQPSDVELDVTELILARTTLAQSCVLEELHRLGVRIAIDDFGTQYSSLDYLRTYHVSRLKIAKPIVAAVTDQSGTSLVRAIMSLASELGVEVIAAGVETQTQCDQLVRLGAHTKGQGFLFSVPAPAAEALQVLRDAGL